MTLDFSCILEFVCQIWNKLSRSRILTLRPLSSSPETEQQSTKYSSFDSPHDVPTGTLVKNHESFTPLLLLRPVKAYESKFCNDDYFTENYNNDAIRRSKNVDNTLSRYNTRLLDLDIETYKHNRQHIAMDSIIWINNMQYRFREKYVCN